MLQNDSKSIKVQKMQKKSKIKTIYLDSYMTKSHFVLEKLCPVNPKKKCKILYYPSPNNNTLSIIVIV
jgi:hypothetical protein